MCGVSAEKIIHVEGGISPTGQFDSSCSPTLCSSMKPYDGFNSIRVGLMGPRNSKKVIWDLKWL